MLDTFITSFRLKNTYRTNTIIYSIRCLPIIGKLLPASLYGSGGLKTFANVISVLWEIAGTFIGKILYMLLMIMLMLAVYDTEPSDTYLHIFTALTVAGGLTNTYMFNPTKDKYYAIVIMGMDARKFAISNYCYSMIKVVVGFLPLTIMLGWFLGVPLWTSVLMPFFVVAVKMAFIAYDIWKFRAKGIATSENMLGKASWIGLGVLLIIAYGPPFLGLSMNLTVFTAAMAVSFALGIAGLISISRFSDYRRLYRLLLTTEGKLRKEDRIRRILYQQQTGFCLFPSTVREKARQIADQVGKKAGLRHHRSCCPGHRRIYRQAGIQPDPQPDNPHIPALLCIHHVSAEQGHHHYSGYVHELRSQHVDLQVLPNP